MELLESIPAPKRKINIKKEFKKYLKNWYWILLSMVLFYLASKIYLRYTENQYLSKTTLKFPESKSKGTAALSDLQTLGVGLQGNDELQSETTAIISKPILTSVVEQLQLNISYFGLGKIKEPELYASSPVYGKLTQITDENFPVQSYTLTAKGNSYTLSDGKLLKGKNQFLFGAPAKLPFGTLTLYKKNVNNFEVRIVLRNTKSAVTMLENAVNVSLPENKGLLMDLTMTSTLPKKSEDILNAITAQYNVEGVKDRNEERQNTQDFINDRLAIISQDLSGIENQKEDFKKENQITDLDAQADLALSNSNENTQKIIDYSTQLDLVNSIYKNSNAEKLLPSNLGLTGNTESLIASYNEKLILRNNTLKQATSQNPSVIALNHEIAELRNLIRQNLMESRATLQAQVAQLQGQLNADRSRISNYPTQEKVFRSIERQQNLKEQLYLYLLQKREENAITLAVTAPKAKVLNPAYTLGIVKPDRQKITLGALAIGFLIPLLFLYTKFALDTKVHTKEQVIAHIPDASVISEIPVHEENSALIAPNDFSVFAESFRILSSNLKFLLKTNKTQSGINKGVILITSSIKSEGKTTIAVNTALTLAGTAKVLLIGADIRNPQLKRFINEPKLGLTDYLISEDLTPEKYIISSGISAHLDVLPSGAIAPNPNDLLDIPKFDEMINTLKHSYDYIVMDSAPVMLVSDTLHLIENADVVLYVIKSDFTENEMLDFSDEFRRTNHIGNMAYILNNVKPENTRYGNKYGYGYYTVSKGKN